MCFCLVSVGVWCLFVGWRVGLRGCLCEVLGLVSAVVGFWFYGLLLDLSWFRDCADWWFSW